MLHLQPPTPTPPLYANCRGSKRTATDVSWLHKSLSKQLATTEVRATDVSWLHKSLSKQLATTEVRATGLKSFIALASVSFGTGMIVLVFHDRGTTCRFISNWKSCYKVSPPPPNPVPSGPGVLCRLSLRKHFVTSGSRITKCTRSSEFTDELRMVIRVH